MRFLLLAYSLFSILLSDFAFGQQTHGMKLYEQLMDNSKVTIHTDNHEKIVFHVGEFKIKPSPEKDYNWYSSNKLQKTQGGYTGKLLHGTYQRYFTNNVLQETGDFSKGLKKGIWSEWHENSNLKKQSKWKKGTENGFYALYDSNGFKLEEGELKQGLKNGKSLVYQHSDSTYTDQFYAMGKTISQQEYIDSNLFRKTGKFFKTQWNKIFSKNKKEEVAIP